MKKCFLWVALVALSPLILYGGLLGVGFAAGTIAQAESALFSEVTYLLGSRYAMRLMVESGGGGVQLEIVGSETKLARIVPSSYDPNWRVFGASNGSWVQTTFGEGILTDHHVIGIYNGVSFTLTKPNDVVWMIFFTINTSVIALGGSGLFLLVGLVRRKVAGW